MSFSYWRVGVKYVFYIKAFCHTSMLPIAISNIPFYVLFFEEFSWKHNFRWDVEHLGLATAGAIPALRMKVKGMKLYYLSQARAGAGKVGEAQVELWSWAPHHCQVLPFSRDGQERKFPIPLSSHLPFSCCGLHWLKPEVIKELWKVQSPGVSLWVTEEYREGGDMDQGRDCSGD